jgi:hypothetical protein
MPSTTCTGSITPCEQLNRTTCTLQRGCSLK